ncbi:hypothetical protein H6F92_07070 [Microcystis wesenbergii FACHB-1317]|nr:hypothetical protein [Microcystis wesenbergii FACHB-1317]
MPPYLLLKIVKLINDVLNLPRWDVRLVRFGIDEDHQNTTIVFKLIDNTIAATFALLNIAVFEVNFKDSVAYSWYLIADEFAYLKVIN